MSFANQAAPAIFFPFQPADSSGIAIVSGQTFQLRKLLVASFDTSANFVRAALAAPVTYSVYWEGNLVGQITTNATAPFWSVVATTSNPLIQQGDALAVVPGAAAGTSRAVCVTLGGLWV